MVVTVAVRRRPTSPISSQDPKLRAGKERRKNVRPGFEPLPFVTRTPTGGLEKLQQRFALGFRGRTANRGAIGPVEACGIVEFRIRQRALGGEFRLLHHEWTVEEIERLRGNGADVSLAEGLVDVAKVEDLEKFEPLRAEGRRVK